MRKFSKGSEDAEINMTPMLDIVFIMLIFFIVTASFVRETGLEIFKHPPIKNPDPCADCDKPILFVLEENSRILFKNRHVDISLVRAIIEREHAASPSVPVIVASSYGASTGLLVQIYDMAQLAGVQHIVVTEKP